MSQNERMAQLEFSVFYRRDARIKELFSICRTANGLYLNNGRDPLIERIKSSTKDGTRPMRSGFSYHEDGTAWFKPGVESQSR